jgi:hypothetical protein
MNVLKLSALPVSVEQSECFLGKRCATVIDGDDKRFAVWNLRKVLSEGVQPVLNLPIVRHTRSVSHPDPFAIDYCEGIFGKALLTAEPRR